MFANSQLSYHVFKDYNIPFDEKGATCGTVRRVQWVKGDAEPDENKSKLEIRHMIVNESGETAGKGYSFSTPEGPNELVIGLIKCGFGDTKEILRAVRQRDDIQEAIRFINEDDEDNDSDSTFDMRDLLLGINCSDDEMENAV